MKPEDKQALIECCTQRVDALNNYCRFNPDDREAALDLSLCKIALDALTAQPVKCPSFADYKPYVAGELRAAFTFAIRAAGYEVQE